MLPLEIGMVYQPSVRVGVTLVSWADKLFKLRKIANFANIMRIFGYVCSSLDCVNKDM